MKQILTILSLAALLFVSCNEKPQATQDTNKTEAEPDSMLYGLSCDGTNDSVIVFLPFVDCADPVTYNIESAKANGRVIGKPQIGDWVGIMLNPQDSTEATMVINLDKLKGTWTYQVRPTWKDASRLTARAMRKNFAAMPDSIKEAYLVPREYGFTLKRSSQASPVGMVRRNSSLEDDSPVEYPKVKYYTGWKARNGHLILTSVDSLVLSTSQHKNATKQKEHHDTLDFIFMSEDSLVLRNSKNEIISFHRKANAITANAEAQKAAQKVTNNKELK